MSDHAYTPFLTNVLGVIRDVTAGNLRARVQLTDDAPAPLKALGAALNELIEAWRASELRARKTKRALEEKVATVETQAVAIRELSTPILQVWRGVLLLPIVGKLDSARGADMTAELLEYIAETQAEQVIIDVTGVAEVDERTADQLVRLARSVRILGVRCVVTGMSAAVAQTLVAIGADLRELHTLRSLEHGLVHCMERAPQSSSAGSS
jgi:rsbT co-antagonist protein RsbR